MSSPQFSHYLLTSRKRSALSQDEIAFLLGAEIGTKISRYENFARMPGLETALAYEVILRSPVSELFGGMYRKIERQVAMRATELLKRSDEKISHRRRDRRYEILADLAALRSR